MGYILPTCTLGAQLRTSQQFYSYENILDRIHFHLNVSILHEVFFQALKSTSQLEQFSS